MIKWLVFAATWLIAVVCVFLLGRTPLTGLNEEEKAQPKAGNGSGKSVAVVELFTSEGCSSCPAADELFGEIVKEARAKRQPVYCLSFHVDYWNNLGWHDPYSDAAFSRRQQEYARVLKSDGVYTPQMIFNGSAECVGSDRRRTRERIDNALKQPADVTLKLSQEETKVADAVVVSYEVSKPPRGSVLSIALVEAELVSKVSRGENHGRTLRHENVVRAFQTIRLGETDDGTVRFKVPADLVRKNTSVIAYVQDVETGKVAGATAIELQPAVAP
jgi:hypothetical protein